MIIDDSSNTADYDDDDDNDDNNVHISLSLSISLSLYIYIYMYRYVCVCMCIYIYIYVYVCMCVYIYTYREREICIHIQDPGEVCSGLVEFRDVSFAYAARPDTKALDGVSFIVDNDVIFVVTYY